MTRQGLSRHPAAHRPGKALVMFALLLPLLLGMVGVTIDGGLLLSTYRQAQNAADAAALAAAMDLYRGQSSATAQSTGTTYVQTYNNMPNATVKINIGPSSGPYQGNGAFAEAIVSYPYSTSFIRLLGVNKSQTVKARAVAGYESVTAGQGAVTLQQNPAQGNTGLQVSGGASLSVNGGITVNATDANRAMTVSGGGTISAINVNVSGGVPSNETSNIQNYNSGGPSPLEQNTGVNEPDPLASLNPPSTTNTAGTNSPLSSTNYGNVSISTGSQTLNPGIYTSISITGGTVTFNPGMYVIQGGQGNTGLNITGGTVTGNGVMFYNTSAKYDPTTGLDGSTKNGDFASINISGSNVNLTALNDSTSPYNGILFFQDRANNNTISLQGGSNGATLTGTTYAPDAGLQISGQGSWSSQFIVGSMSVTGQGTVTIQYNGKNLGKAPEVFLVE